MMIYTRDKDDEYDCDYVYEDDDDHRLCLMNRKECMIYDGAVMRYDITG